jgi:hypothetical protein
MKSPTLNRILEKTPTASLAALSVGAFFRYDTTELERIYGALPSHRRESRREFFIQHHALTESILLWVIEFWKTHSMMQSMTALIVDRESSPRDVIGGNLIYRANKAKLASLIEAMRQICSANGITFEDVATFAEVNVDEIDVQPVTAMVTEFVDMFSMPSGRGEK